MFKDEKKFKQLNSDSFLIQNISAKTRALNLSVINNGVDSLELRIWHGITIAQPNQLIILNYHDSSWHITKTDYWLESIWTDGKPTNVKLDSSFSKSVLIPASLSRIIDSIYQFRLDTFPTQNQIPNFENTVADGVFYQIELATPKFYKAVLYVNPGSYQDVYNQRISRLVKLLDSIGVWTMP